MYVCMYIYKQMSFNWHNLYASSIIPYSKHLKLPRDGSSINQDHVYTKVEAVKTAESLCLNFISFLVVGFKLRKKNKILKEISSLLNNLNDFITLLSCLNKTKILLIFIIYFLISLVLLFSPFLYSYIFYSAFSRK